MLTFILPYITDVFTILLIISPCYFLTKRIFDLGLERIRSLLHQNVLGRYYTNPNIQLSDLNITQMVKIKLTNFKKF